MALTFDTIHRITKHYIPNIISRRGEIQITPKGDNLIEYKNGFIKPLEKKLEYSDSDFKVVENLSSQIKNTKIKKDIIYTLHPDSISFRKLGKKATYIKNIRADLFCVGNEIIICFNDVISNINKTWSIKGEGVRELYWCKRLYWLDSNGLNVYYNNRVESLFIYNIRSVVPQKRWLYIAIDNVIYSNEPRKWTPSNNFMYDKKKEYKNLYVYFILQFLPLELNHTILELMNLKDPGN